MALPFRVSRHVRSASPITGAGVRGVIVITSHAQRHVLTLISHSGSRSQRQGSSSPRAYSSNAPSSRSLHSSSNRPSSENLTLDSASTIISTPPEGPTDDMATRAPLAVLPLTNIVRSLFTTSISSSSIFLPPSLAIMTALANAKSPVLMPDRNPLLRSILKHSFYAQFCAGENGPEVRRTIDSLKTIGFSGVILGYAKEVVLTEEQTKNLTACDEGAAGEECIRSEINPWAVGTMETVLLASPGDFVALKFTGAGRQALYSLSHRLAPSEALGSAIDSICRLAADRGVRLLFDAEQQAVQAGIDDWTLAYMRKYNTATRAVIYGTYQAYLKATPRIVSEHLALAKKEGFALGVKLVRGAYIGSDPRALIHDTKADTDAAYDGVAARLLTRTWGAPLTAPEHDSDNADFPEVQMVLASHNQDSVRKARALLDGGARQTEVAFAQLQGMADEVSCELVSVGKALSAAGDKTRFAPPAYKYLVWGSTGECMKYLLRRAHENRDAVQRTRNGRDAMRAELFRRVKALFGLA